MDKRGPQMGKCLCGEPATIRETKAEDGRLHFMCQDLTPEGKSKHYGFVDKSEGWRLETGSDATKLDESSTSKTAEEQPYAVPGVTGVRW